MSVPGAVSADEELIHVREVLADVAVRVGADRIELFTGGAGIHGEYRVSFEAVSVPAQPDAIDMVDAVDVVERVRDLIHEFGFYAVEQAAADAADGADEEDEDRGGDDQPDDRVSQREAEQASDSTGNDGEGGEAVGAGVDAVRDQRGGPDALSDADPVHGDDLVTEEPDDPGSDHPADVGERLRVEEAVDGLPGGNDSATTNTMNRPRGLRHGRDRRCIGGMRYGVRG